MTATTPIIFSGVKKGIGIKATPIPSFVSRPEDEGRFSSSNALQEITLSSDDVLLAPSPGNGQVVGTTRNLRISIRSYPLGKPESNRPFFVGQEISLDHLDPATTQYALVQFAQTTQHKTKTPEARPFDAQSYVSSKGKLIIRALGTNSVTLELVNVEMAQLQAFGPGPTLFTLNGTIAATGLAVNK